MKPWDIIGWILLGLLAFSVALAVLGVALKVFGRWLLAVTRRGLHYATRYTPPAEGQLWQQDDDMLVIGKVHDNGNLQIKGGNRSWTDSPQSWQERVRGRRLFLVSSGNGADPGKDRVEQ